MFANLEPAIDSAQQCAAIARSHRVFCLLNGRDLTFSVDEAEALVLAVASGDLDVPEIATTTELHLR
jgi:death on curing protein